MTVAVYSSPYPDSVYADDPGVTKDAAIVVDMPDLSGGLDRPNDVSMKFGQSTIKVEAVNRKTKAQYKAELKFDKAYGK